jgi:hypothetical protein
MTRWSDMMERYKSSRRKLADAQAAAYLAEHPAAGRGDLERYLHKTLHYEPQLAMRVARHATTKGMEYS